MATQSTQAEPVEFPTVPRKRLDHYFMAAGVWHKSTPRKRLGSEV
jgi:hypothetical protein